MKCQNPVEEIVVDFVYETESDEGDKTIHAYALDGRILLITKPNPTKLAELKKGISDESKQEDYADWLRRGGNRTFGSPLLCLLEPQRWRQRSRCRHGVVQLYDFHPPPQAAPPHSDNALCGTDERGDPDTIPRPTCTCSHSQQRRRLVSRVWRWDRDQRKGSSGLRNSIFPGNRVARHSAIFSKLP